MYVYRIMHKFRYHVVLILLLLYLDACAHTIKVSPNLTITPLEGKPSHKVGLYMSQELCNFAKKFTPNLESDKLLMGPLAGLLTHKLVFPMGGPLCQGTEEILKRIFPGLERFSSPNLSSHPCEVKFVVIPDLVAVDLAVVERRQILKFFNPFLPGFPGKFSALIIVKWTAIDCKGDPIWIDTFQGKGWAKTGWFESYFTTAGKAMDRAIEDMFKKANDEVLSSRFWEY